MHSFLSAFELSSRLPSPSPASAPSAPSPLRFSTEQMLEVLEAALQSPQHGLASEGNLLRWQLRSHLRYGHAPPSPPPPLECAPPEAQPRMQTPRVVVVMPFVGAEKARVMANLGSWRDGGGLEPCALTAAATAQPRSSADTASADAATSAAMSAVDLMLYPADPPGHSSLSWLTSAEQLLGSGARCFRRAYVRHANLTSAEQHYIGGWDNTGPNNLFYRLFFDRWLHREYDAMLWMEVRGARARRPALVTTRLAAPRVPRSSLALWLAFTHLQADVVPIQPLWLERLVEEAVAPRGYWRKGPAQQPRLAHAMVSTHHYHMNSAGLYRLGQPCFVALLRRIASEFPDAPHDVSTHWYLHEPRHFHIWQAHAHRFLYTDFVQNRLDEWTEDAVRAVSADTFLVHGKHRQRQRTPQG